MYISHQIKENLISKYVEFFLANFPYDYVLSQHSRLTDKLTVKTSCLTME